MAKLKVLSSLVLLTASALALKGAIGGGEPLDPPPPVNTEFAGVLVRIGIPADTLACAGIVASQVPGMAAATQAQYSATRLASLDQAFVDAKAARDRLVRKVRSGLASPQEISSRAEVEATFAEAETARKNHLDLLQNAALGTVSTEQAATVRRINANRSWGLLPLEFLVKNRTEPQWVELRAAVATERIAAQDDEEICPPSTQAYLAQIRAETEIASAKVNLDANIAAVQTAWNSAASN
jgi:hypothetical protein